MNTGDPFPSGHCRISERSSKTGKFVDSGTRLYLFEKATDLTHHMRNGMPIYPGDPSPSFENYATLENVGVNPTKLIMGSHTGTHVDAPKHFIRDGIGIDRSHLTS